MKQNVKWKVVEKIKLERRSFEIREFKIGDNEENISKFSGYAAVFNTLSEDLGYFREKIRLGAFSNAIKNDDVRALFNHDENFVLGRNRAGTLRMKEDEQGLWFEVDIPNTQWAKDLLESVKRGDISQCSFGFRVLSDDWYQEGGATIRELKDVKLYDVSVVTYPAYTQTSVQERSYKEVYENYAQNKEKEERNIISKLEIEKKIMELKTKI